MRLSERLRTHLSTIAIGYPIAIVVVFVVLRLLGFPILVALLLSPFAAVAAVIGVAVFAFWFWLELDDKTPRQERRERERQERLEYERYERDRQQGRD